MQLELNMSMTLLEEKGVRLLESLIMIFLACYTIYRPHVSYLFLFHLSLVIHDL